MGSNPTLSAPKTLDNQGIRLWAYLFWEWGRMKETGEDFPNFGEELGKVNRHLTTLQIRVKGKKLYLRGTLQGVRREISTGQAATPEGLQQAFELAKTFERVHVTSWTEMAQACEKETIGDWLKRFEKNYWESRDKNLKSLSTWRNCYEAFFNRLDIVNSINIDTNVG